ncbi:MAG: DUF2442 domain-containing protein [Methylococcales symbiont of Iophon sp. n. MRB-2018]|nr:MAG: DUF2442 domain-containing protein [Methylococcales symbiont of Iophon sp. n. MRB-2018]
MNPHVVSVEVKQEYILKLAFENKEIRLFDTSPFLDKGIFNELKDINYFKQVKVAFGAVEWPHEQDFSKDTLYLLSTPLKS